MEPGEIARPSAHERLREREKSDEKPRRDGIELRLDPRAQHVRDRHAKRSAEHEVRHDPQAREKNPEPEKEHGQREPFDAAQVARHIRLRRGINRLEQSFAENAVVNNRRVNEPAETRGAVDLPAPFRRAGRTEKNQMFEAKKRFRLAVAFLLFAKRAQSETAV